MCVHLSSVTFDIGNVCRANFRTISGENVPSLIPVKARCDFQETNFNFKCNLYQKGPLTLFHVAFRFCDNCIRCSAVSFCW